MIGIIERIKNNVLLKCGNLNDEVIAKELNDALNKKIYQFAEELISMLDDINLNITEDIIRQNVTELIKTPIMKKIKRKLFIDSLALQITNDGFIEDFVNKEITFDKLIKTYVKELEKNKKSNQLNMTEDLNLEEIFQGLQLFLQRKVISKIDENNFLVSSINKLVDRTKTELEDYLEKMIRNLDLEYLDILSNEIKSEINDEEIEKEEEGEIDMISELENVVSTTDKVDDKKVSSMVDKYDDMTLFNKIILSLNTKEERLTRSENKLLDKKKKIEELLTQTNKKIESNIERENKLSQIKLDLSNKEKELNAKLSEAEVIFLNMKPLIKGLNSIKSSDGGNYNE